MQIHQITKKSQVDEGLLSGIKNAISSAIDNAPGVNYIKAINNSPSSINGIKVNKWLSPVAHTAGRQEVERSKADAAIQQLAKQGYNIPDVKPQSQMPALDQYINKVNPNELKNLAKSFSTSAVNSAARGTQSTNAQSLDLNKFQQDNTAALAAKQQSGREALAQVQKTQAANASKVKKDNRDQAKILALQKKLAAGVSAYTFSDDERALYKKMRSAGLVKEDQSLKSIESRLLYDFANYTKGFNTQILVDKNVK